MKRLPAPAKKPGTGADPEAIRPVRPVHNRPRQPRRKLSAMRWLVPLIILVAAGIGCWLALRPESRIVSCNGAKATQLICWQQRYAAMTTEQSPEAAFKDFKAVYNTDAFVKTNCHQIAHAIGRSAARRYGTLAKTYAHGDNFCWSGYYHGAVETVSSEIGAKGIEAQVNTICASFLKAKPYGFDHYNCVHGLGHGIMALENGELFTALKICDKLDGQWQQSSCYSGVYMENVMNEINPGKHSKYLKADDPLYPCTVVGDRYKNDCYMMQTSHALIVEKYDYSKVFAVCGTVASPYDQVCYQSLGRDVSGQSSSDQATTVERCMLGQTTAARQNCFVGAVKDFVSYYHSESQGLAMCAAIPDSDLSASCAQTAREYYKVL